MKAKLKSHTIGAVLLAGLLTINAADKKTIGGPKGGRLLEKTDPRAEFYVEKDRTVTIAFYDAALKPVPAAAQTVTVIADAKDGKAKLEFEKKGDVLVSKTKLPEGDGYSLVVQFKPTTDAKPQNFRFKLETHECGECKRSQTPTSVEIQALGTAYGQRAGDVEDRLRASMAHRCSTAAISSGGATGSCG